MLSVVLHLIRVVLRTQAYVSYCTWQIKKHWFPRSDQHLYLIIISSWERALVKIAVLILPVIKFHDSYRKRNIYFFLVITIIRQTSLNRMYHWGQWWEKRWIQQAHEHEPSYPSSQRCTVPSLCWQTSRLATMTDWRMRYWLRLVHPWCVAYFHATFLPSFILVWIPATVLVCALIKWLILVVS